MNQDILKYAPVIAGAGLGGLTGGLFGAAKRREQETEDSPDRTNPWLYALAGAAAGGGIGYGSKRLLDVGRNVAPQVTKREPSAKPNVQVTPQLIEQAAEQVIAARPDKAEEVKALVAQSQALVQPDGNTGSFIYSPATNKVRAPTAQEIADDAKSLAEMNALDAESKRVRSTIPDFRRGNEDSARAIQELDAQIAASRGAVSDMRSNPKLDTPVIADSSALRSKMEPVFDAEMKTTADITRRMLRKNQDDGFVSKALALLHRKRNLDDTTFAAGRLRPQPTKLNELHDMAAKLRSVAPSNLITQLR